MSGTNVIEKIGEDIVHGVEVAAKDVEKALTVVEKTGAVVDAVIKDEGEIKTVAKQILQDGVTLSAKVSQVVTEKGLSIADDAALLAEIEAYFTKDIEGLLVPEVEKVFGDLQTAAA